MNIAQRVAPKTITHRLNDYIQYSEVKRLADNIIMLQRQKKFHSLAVISFFQGEGKTLFTAAMAMSYTQNYSTRVLVVDTTTFQNSQSLVLKHCLESSTPMIDYTSLEDFRNGTNGTSFPGKEKEVETPVVEPEVVDHSPMDLVHKRESDRFLIAKLFDERASHYGLILVDTASLTAKNKSNIDPLVIARMCDASILIVSPQLLQASNLQTHLKILKDPLLHLVGMVSNEEAFR